MDDPFTEPYPTTRADDTAMAPDPRPDGDTERRNETERRLRTVLDALPADATLRSLAMIERSATTLAAMVGELTDLSHLQSGQQLELDLKPSDLVALARRCAEEAQQTTTAHTIRVETSVEALVGHCDSDCLGRVLANLLSNAIKYSPNGGAIAVTLNVEDGATIAFAGHASACATTGSASRRRTSHACLIALTAAQTSPAASPAPASASPAAARSSSSTAAASKRPATKEPAPRLPYDSHFGMMNDEAAAPHSSFIVHHSSFRILPP
jgi:two-component sensor histidine kinase